MNLIFYVIIVVYVYIYIYNKDYLPVISSHVDKSLLKKYNISESDWCSVEIKSYIVLFFLCFEKLPNISIFMK